MRVDTSLSPDNTERTYEPPQVDSCQFRKFVTPSLIWCQRYLQIMDGTGYLCRCCQTEQAYREEMERRLKEFEVCFEDPGPRCPIFHIQKSLEICQKCREDPEERIKIAVKGIHGFFEEARERRVAARDRVCRELEGILKEVSAWVPDGDPDLETIRLALLSFKDALYLNRL